MPCFTSYSPAGSTNSATHTHGQAQVLSSPSCSSKTPHHPTHWPQALLFQFSPSLPPQGLFSQPAAWGPSLDHNSSLQPLFPAISLPPCLPSHTPGGGGQPMASSLLPRVAGATPTRPHCNARVPRVGCSQKATQQAPPSKNVPASSCLPHPHCHPQGTSPAASEKLWKPTKETARPWPGSLKLPHILASSPLPSGLSLCERPPSIWTLSSPALVSS